MRLGRLITGARLLLEGERARLAAFVTPDTGIDSLLEPSFRESLQGSLAAHFRTRKSPRFFIDDTERSSIVEAFLDRHGGAPDSIIRDANTILDHRFSLLGAKDAQLGRAIDWHRDFKSGVRWNPKAYYKLVGKLRKYPDADVKVPWELSRFQHLPTLGKAYWLTRDEKYADEFVDQVTHWLANNPPLFGINWACAMDVSIRITNWIWGWYFFKDSPVVDDQFVTRFLTSICSHGDYIANNLEILSFEGKLYKNNHYLSDLVGLAYLGILFPELRDANQWLSIGLQGLKDEMSAQVCEDGVSFELSIPYHRLALELFLYPAILCRLNDIELSSDYFAKLERMLEFTAVYTKPDGHAPQIGDADDGRLHVLSNYREWERRDHRYLLSIGADLFDREGFRAAAGQSWEEAFWLTDALQSQGRTPVVSPEPVRTLTSSQAFTSSGYYIMRARGNFLAINATDVGTAGLGGHKHCDVLSFELCVDGTTFLVDPGTYLYTPDPGMRNLFRSTAYHNTIQVDGEEQNRLIESNLFLMREEARPFVRAWECNSEYDYFDGEHYGYCRFADPIMHRREIYADKAEGFWIVRDTLQPPESPDGIGARDRETATHSFAQHLHFAPMDVEFVDGMADIPEKAAEVLCSRFARGEDELVHSFSIAAVGYSGTTLIGVPLLASSIEKEVLQGWVSKAYGVKERASIVRMEKEGADAEFLTLFYQGDR